MAQKGRVLAPALPSALICGAQLYHGGTYFGSTGCPEPPLKDTVRQHGCCFECFPSMFVPSLSWQNDHLCVCKKRVQNLLVLSYQRAVLRSRRSPPMRWAASSTSRPCPPPPQNKTCSGFGSRRIRHCSCRRSNTIGNPSAQCPPSDPVGTCLFSTFPMFVPSLSWQMFGV